MLIDSGSLRNNGYSLSNLIPCDDDADDDDDELLAWYLFPALETRTFTTQCYLVLFLYIKHLIHVGWSAL